MVKITMISIFSAFKISSCYRGKQRLLLVLTDLSSESNNAKRGLWPTGLDHTIKTMCQNKNIPLTTCSDNFSNIFSEKMVEYPLDVVLGYLCHTVTKSYSFLMK